jgi:hypothetical protein
MDNTQEESGFDYKSRDWEKSMSKPVCVACLNESRTHQIPGEYEHICGKQPANNASDTQLPAEVVEEIKAEAKSYAQNFTFPHFWDEDNEEFALPVVEQVYEEIATEYATKLHDRDQKIALLTKARKSETEFIDKAIALLEKFISRHEAGLLPDRFIYNEIKTFLDGTK